MKSGHLLNPNLSADDLSAIEEILRSNEISLVGYDSSTLDELQPDIDLGIVALPLPEGSEPIVNDRVESFVARGIRVVSIWLRRSDGGLPAIIGDCGSSVVSIGSSDMAQALSGDGGEVWELSSGDERPVQPTPRNRC